MIAENERNEGGRGIEMQPQTTEDEDDGNVKKHSAVSVALAASQTPQERLYSRGSGGERGSWRLIFNDTLHKSTHTVLDVGVVFGFVRRAES